MFTTNVQIIIGELTTIPTAHVDLNIHMQNTNAYWTKLQVLKFVLRGFMLTGYVMIVLY